MELSSVTYQGPAVRDLGLLEVLPKNLRGLLEQINGFVLYGGGLHVRGACDEPSWHSLKEAWTGPEAIHKLFPAVLPTDIPFGQDCVGDQFLLRDAVVVRLRGETGVVEPTTLTLRFFLEAVENDPVRFLSLNPLLQFRRDGDDLEPGQLLGVYPPFVFERPPEGYSFRAMAAKERISFLSMLAAELKDVPDGGRVTFKVVQAPAA